MEIRYGEFSAGVELPPGLDIQHAQAEYENGFLTIIFPKLKPTGITIQG
jgi:HSP20 family molecular chaperone IbpA